MYKVRKWGNEVSIIKYSDTDGYLSGSVSIPNKKTWEKIKKNVDRYFIIDATNIEIEIKRE